MRSALRYYYYTSGGSDPAYQAVIDYNTAQGFELPSTQQQSNENLLMRDFRTGGILDRALAIYTFKTNAGIDHTCTNWKTPGTFQLLKSAIPPFHFRKEGAQGDGSAAQYFDTQFIPATHGGSLYTISKSSIAIGILTNVDDSGDLEFGAANGSNANRTFILPRSGANIIYCMSAATTRSVGNGSNSIGNYVVRRNGSTIFLDKNGVAFDNSVVAAQGLPTVSILLLGENGNGTPRNFSARMIDHVLIGDFEGLSGVIHTAISNYRTRCLLDDPAERKFLWEGDSITAGTGTRAGLSYPRRTYINLNRKIKYNNIGVPGWTSAQMLARVSDYGQYLNTDGVFVLFTGTNDVLASTATATTWSNIQGIISAVQALGVTRIAIGTLMDCSTYSGAQQTLRSDLNTLIRNNTSLGYVVMDFSATAELGTHSATYFDDTVHPNNAGAAVMATVANTAIDSLI